MMTVIDKISPNRIKPNDFVVLIEIPRGSKKKYELDKETGYIILDRVLYTSTHYPANYGLIPKTLANDGDHLDVLVLCSEQIDTNCIVRCYPIGMIEMQDQNFRDEKIIAIPFGDPQYNSYNSITELPTHMMDEFKHFFSVYKQLEGKTTAVDKVYDRDVAENTIKACMENFNKVNNKDVVDKVNL